jgi:hypothetical protein
LVRYRGRGGFRPTPRDYTVSTSTTIQSGDIVQITTGSVVIPALSVATDSTAVNSGGNLPILGIATDGITTDAAGVESGTGRTTIPVVIFDDNVEIGLRVYAASAADAELNDLTVGTTYQFCVYRATGALNRWFMAITTTTNGELVLTDKPSWVAGGDDYGFAFFRANTSETVRQA